MDHLVKLHAVSVQSLHGRTFFVACQDIRTDADPK